MLVGLVACAPELPWAPVSPSDPLIQYIGRVDFTRPTPEFSYPGTTVRLRFAGTAVAMVLDDRGQGGSEGTNYYQVTIDGGRPWVLEAKGSMTRYVLAEDLASGIHTVEVVKRTESKVGWARLLGFELRGELQTPLARRQRRMEVVGDAMACGYGVEVRIFPPELGGDPATGFHSANQNHQAALGARLAEALRAEVVTVCQSGAGVLRNEDGSTSNTLPTLYGRAVLKPGDSPWDFRQYIPDVVVINAGTSDFSPEAPFLERPSPLDNTAFRQAYRGLVRQVREAYPNARIVCAVGVMLNDYYPPERNQSTRQRTLVQEVVQELNGRGDLAVYYQELSAPSQSYYGEDWHPSAEAHQGMADELSPLIRTVTGW
jgi:lysophospholipase L1-like esterase